MFGLGGLITGGLGSLFGLANGIMQNKKANKLDKMSVRPFYGVPSEIGQNKILAERLASQGMGGTQYNNNLNNINRNLSSGLQALAMQRQGLAGIGNLVAQGNDAALNLDAQDDLIRRQNQGVLFDANNTLAQYKDKAFQYNNADKYAEEQAKIAAYRNAANQNFSNSIGGLSGLGLTYFMNRNSGLAA